MNKIKFIWTLAFSFFFFGTLHSQIEEKLQFEWEEVTKLSDAKGVNGAFTGVHNDVLIIAGGANFPDTPVWEQGSKVWYDAIRILGKQEGEFQWIDAAESKLPRPLAYGASVTLPQGVLIMGGNNAEGTYNEVFLLKWNSVDQSVSIEEQASLPVPLANMQATTIGEVVYVVAGQEEEGEISQAHLFSFKIGADWKKLPDLPGKGRIQPVVVSQNNGKTDCLYVFSGTHFNPNADDPNQFLGDAYEFNPLTSTWTEKAPVPFNNTPGMENGYIGAAPALELGDSHIVVFGGAGGENQLWTERLALQKELAALDSGNYTAEERTAKSDSISKQIKETFQNTSFSKTIWVYHAITDTWSERGSIPGEAQVVANAVQWGDDIIIAAGEISPGIRTPIVNKVSIIPSKASFGWANYTTLFLYLAFIMGIGVYFSKRNKSTADYFLASGRIPWWAAGLSIYATMLSAITYLSQPALAYSYDWQAYLGYFTILLIVPIVTTYYLPFYRKLNITTAYEYLEMRFNVVLRMFGSTSFILFQLARMGIVMYLPALALATVVGIDIYTAIILMGVLAIVYTVLGGIEAVIWTDVIQVGVLLGGLIIGLVYIAMDIGDLGYIFNTALEDGKLQMVDLRWSWTEVVTWSLFLGSFALNFAPYTTDQAVVQRYLTTSDEKEARKSIWLNGLISIPAGLLIFAMGTFLYVYFKDNPEFIAVGMKNDGIFPLFIANHLPPGVAGLVIAGIYSASMSSLDSSIHSISTVTTVDYYQRFSSRYTEKGAMKVAQWTTIIVGVLGTAVACLMAAFPITSLFFFFQEIVGLFGSAIAGIFILGIFFKRANWIGTLIGAVLSVISLVLVKYNTPINFYIYPLIAIPVCVIGGYLASLIFPVKNNPNENLVYRKSLKNEI